MKKDKCSQPLPVKTFKVITGKNETFMQVSHLNRALGVQMRSIQSVFQ